MLKKMLIVDYSTLRQQVYRLVMGRYDCTIINTLNGQDALEVLTTQQDIDLVLLDINIAGMSSLEFLEKVSQLGMITRVPVILISSAGREEETQQGINLGARESLRRPFNPARLHEKIEKILSGPKEKMSYQQEVGVIMAIAEKKNVTERIYWRGAMTKSISLNLGGELLNGLKGSDSLIVNLDGVELLDYSCLVLLCAVKRQASEKGQKICLEGQANPVVAPVIDRFRVNGNQLCRAYCGNSCLFD